MLAVRGWPPQERGEYKYCPVYYFRCTVASLGGPCDMTMTSVAGHLTEVDFPSQYR